MIEVQGVKATFRPISDWPGERTDKPRRSPFRAGWSSTLKLFEKEVAAVIKKDEKPVIEMGLREHQIRRDGLPRMDARPADLGVIVNIESKFAQIGHLRYAVDSFDSWQDNFRAIALALEALRKVDRYGVTKRGEQYAGWKALPPAKPFTIEDAAEVLVKTAGFGSAYSIADLIDKRETFIYVYRAAVKQSHPDKGGTVGSFQRVQEAYQKLRKYHGLEALT